MQTAISVLSFRRMRSLVLGSVTFVAVAIPLLSQDAVNPPKKPSPPKIEKQNILVGEPVEQVQWAHTLKLVNAPTNVALLNPGGCVRVGIVATGDNRDEYLEKTRLSFRVKFAGQNQAHPSAEVHQTKQIKPEGGDFVTAALAAGGVKNPMLTMASLGVSTDNWCVPSDAADGRATVEAEVESPSGHETLKSATIQIESFESGSKRLFKDPQELSRFLQTYYRQPEPARLIPALQLVIDAQKANPSSDFIVIAAAFLSAALKADPVAAKDFLARVATQPPLTRGFGLVVLHSAGYDIESVVRSLDTEEQQKFRSIPPLDDPYDLTPTRAMFGHLDLMWSTFGATGQFEPIKTIASTLSWRPDYDEFDKARKAPDHHLTLTPSVVRGLAYTAAGWSLGSFQQNDPLAADYIDYLLASPEVTPLVKSELNGLATNPAFKHEDKK